MSPDRLNRVVKKYIRSIANPSFFDATGSGSKNIIFKDEVRSTFGESYE